MLNLGKKKKNNFIFVYLLELAYVHHLSVSGVREFTVNGRKSFPLPFAIVCNVRLNPKKRNSLRSNCVIFLHIQLDFVWSTLLMAAYRSSK